MRANELGQAIRAVVAAELKDQLHLEFGAQVTATNATAHLTAQVGSRSSTIDGLPILDLGYQDGVSRGDSLSVFYGRGGQAAWAIPGCPIGTRALPS